MLCPRTPKCFVPPLILIPIPIRIFFFFFPEELSTVDTVCSFARSARSGVALQCHTSLPRPLIVIALEREERAPLPSVGS